MKSLNHKLNQKKPPTEHEEQVAFVNWMRLQFPAVRFYTVPNGLRTGFKQAIKAKREGMSAGVPDICVPAWSLYIEMKRTVGGVLSQDQKEWIHYLEEHCNQKVIVAKGCSDAVRQVMEFIDNKNI